MADEEVPQGLAANVDLLAKTVGRDAIYGLRVSDCIVDLDTQVFVGMTFRNCVIRSRGGTFILRNVTFLNCRFVLELPEGPRSPSEQRFLQALYQRMR